jgi:A/G-specific adenine glycosylase
MELGALVCRPRTPACPACPVARHCLALARGTTLLRPVLPERKAAIPVAMAAGILRRGDAVLLRQRPPDALMPSLWEFPGCVVADGLAPREALCAAFASELGLDVEPAEKFAVVRHGFTNHACTLHAYLCHAAVPLPAKAPEDAGQGRWVALADLPGYAFGAGQRKLVELLLRDLRFAP